MVMLVVGGGWGRWWGRGSTRCVSGISSLFTSISLFLTWSRPCFLISHLFFPPSIPYLSRKVYCCRSRAAAPRFMLQLSQGRGITQGAGAVHMDAAACHQTHRHTSKKKKDPPTTFKKEKRPTNTLQKRKNPSTHFKKKSSSRTYNALYKGKSPLRPTTKLKTSHFRNCSEEHPTSQDFCHWIEFNLDFFDELIQPSFPAGLPSFKLFSEKLS